MPLLGTGYWIPDTGTQGKGRVGGGGSHRISVPETGKIPDKHCLVSSSVQIKTLVGVEPGMVGVVPSIVGVMPTMVGVVPSMVAWCERGRA